MWYAALLWTLHPRVALMAGGPALVTLAAAMAAGWSWSQAGLWAVFVAVAVAAISRRYRILTLTDHGFVLLESSSLRQVAREVVGDLPADVDVRKIGGNLITSEWSVDGETYTVTKRAEKELEQMMAHHRNR